MNGDASLEVEEGNIDLDTITDEDLELIYGEPAEKVRRKIAASRKRDKRK